VETALKTWLASSRGCGGPLLQEKAKDWWRDLTIQTSSPQWVGSVDGKNATFYKT